MTLLERSILATVVYYDTIDKPLTSWEIFRFLINPSYISKKKSKKPNFNKILRVLEEKNNLSQFINEKNGFYFLKSRDELIRKRINKQKIADIKWRKAKKYIKFLKIVPYIRLVAISGSLSFNNTHKDSDIDLLIISKSNKIWTCRIFTTLITHLLGKRRYGKLTKDRLCLNHYITINSLNMPYQSLYAAQLYAHLIPIYQDKNNLALYNRFQEKNQWIKNYLLFYPKLKQKYLFNINTEVIFKTIKKFIEYLLNNRVGDLLEKKLNNIQKQRIKKNPLTYVAGGRVVFNDSQLEFHPKSPEKRIIDAYNQKMKFLGLRKLSQEKDSGLIH